VALVAPAARADTLVAPQVFVRASGASANAWQPLTSSFTTSSVAAYDIGVKLQTTSAPFDRQAIEVDLLAHPGAKLPDSYAGVEPYLPECDITAGDPGSIQQVSGQLVFIGDGTYALRVSVYTEDQHDAFPPTSPQTCNGGPATTVTFSYDATTAPSIVGSPLVPRTTRRAGGFAGLSFTVPAGNTGNAWRCALNPTRRADGAVTGSAVSAGSSNQGAHGVVTVPEATAFSRPGRWACSTRAVAGDATFGFAYTAWAATPTVTVKGQYEWDPNTATLADLSHGRVRVNVSPVNGLGPVIAHSPLKFVLYRSSCSRRRIVNRRVLALTVRLNGRGRASYSFRAPTTPSFYIAQLVYGGSPFVLRGPDPNGIDFEASFDSFSRHTVFGFTGAYAPCG
jgi:hypothetical protein